MAKDYAIKFYNTKPWKICRKSFIASRIMIDGGLCQKCKIELGYIVHHVIEINESNINDIEVTLNHDNLEYVCHGCHNKMHGHETEQAKIIFDSEGNPVPLPP